MTIEDFANSAIVRFLLFPAIVGITVWLIQRWLSDRSKIIAEFELNKLSLPYGTPYVLDEVVHYIDDVADSGGPIQLADIDKLRDIIRELNALATNRGGKEPLKPVVLQPALGASELLARHSAQSRATTRLIEKLSSREALDFLRFFVDVRPSAAWSGIVTNRGKKTAKGVRLEVEDGVYLTLNRHGSDAATTKIKEVVDIGDLQPSESVRVTVWTSLPVWFRASIVVRHDDGIGVVTQRVPGSRRWVELGQFVSGAKWSFLAWMTFCVIIAIFLAALSTCQNRDQARSNRLSPDNKFTDTNSGDIR